jgi:hypothetical protein
VSRREPFTMIHAFAAAGLVIEEEVSRNAAIAHRLADAKFASYFPPEPGAPSGLAASCDASGDA